VFSLSNPGPPHTSISTTKLFSATKGIVSALAVSPDDILATGTFNDVISIFSRSYEHISTFNTSRVRGITQIIWSSDARYMYIIPRQSQDIEVWDIRSTGEMVSVLTGRQAVTNQRIWADLSADGSWLVSGGTDGNVRGWKTDQLDASVKPSMEFKAHNGNLFREMF
jgi:WD40 repeat protein